MKRALVSFVLLCAAFAQCFAETTGVPYFPQTLPGQTVVGRLSANPGATEAIPFASLSRVLQPNVFDLTYYKAKCDGVTDDKAAFTSLAAAVRAAGGGRIEFPSGKSCLVYSTNPAAGAYILMDLSGTNGVTVNFNGSQIVSAVNFGIGINFRLIQLQNSYNITINDFKAAQTFWTLDDQNNGFQGIYVVGQNSNIQINNARQTYGRSFLEVVLASSSEPAIAARTNGISVNGLYTTTVHYPLSFQRNGDGFFGRRIVAVGAGRIYFPYNVTQHDVWLESQPVTGITANDVLVKVYADPTWSAAGNTTSDISVHYRLRTGTMNGASLVALAAQQLTTTTTAAVIRNIAITLDVASLGASNEATAFVAYKTKSDDTNDTTTRGYTIEGVRLSGSVTGYANNSNIFEWGTQGTWGSETIRNAAISDFTTTGSGTGAFAIDATAFSNISFKQVRSAHNLTLTNYSSTTVDAYDGTTFPNLASSYAFSMLPALRDMSTTGLIARTAANTVAARTLTGGSAGFSLTNADGVSGNPTITLNPALASLGNISFVQGDLPYADGSVSFNRLAKDTNATRYLSNQGTSNNPSWNQVNLANGVTGTLPVTNGGTNAAAFTQGSVVFAGASGTYTQDNSNFFWDATNHRLGIGTVAPLAPLHIANSSAIILVDSVSTTAAPAFTGRGARTSIASPTAVQADDGLFLVGGRGYGTTAYSGGSKAALAFNAAETWTDSAQGAYAAISTTTIGGSSRVERLRISDAGNIKIVGSAVRGTTEGTGHLDLFNATDPVGTLTNGTSLYSSGGQMFAMNAAGTATQLTVAPASIITYTVTGVNFNSANTDNAVAITLPSGFTRFVINAVTINHASGTLTTATCGVFTAAAAGGIAIVTSGSAITVSTASEETNNNVQALTVNNQNTLNYKLTDVPTLYFRVQNAQGSAATGDVSIRIVPQP